MNRLLGVQSLSRMSAARQSEVAAKAEHDDVQHEASAAESALIKNLGLILPAKPESRIAGGELLDYGK